MTLATGPDYSVDISPSTGTRWRVVWMRNNLPYRPYFIDASDIDAVSAAIRAALETLVLHSTRGAFAGGRRTEAVPILRALLGHGYTLYDTLFTTADGDAQATADHIRDDLRKRGDRPTIWFRIDDSIHVPWALMSDAPAPAPPDDGTPASYPSLWALKYSVATIYDALMSAEDLHPPHDAETFAVVAGVHRGFHEKAREQVAATNEAAVFEVLEQRYDAPATNSTELLNRWNDRERTIGLLYLYCHGSQKQVGFEHGDLLDTAVFKRDYKKKSYPPRCLVFLNGCHTAAGGFLKATGRAGFYGFIGAETVVPFAFAHRFGAAVIASLYAGERLHAVLDRLRKQHWPLSLVYGLYAYPFLELIPCFERLALSPENYSDMTVGSETL